MTIPLEHWPTDSAVAFLLVATLGTLPDDGARSVELVVTRGEAAVAGVDQIRLAERHAGLAALLAA